jgi:MFS transporter, DHA1 family, multidrug resistance protein
VIQPFSELSHYLGLLGMPGMTASLPLGLIALLVYLLVTPETNCHKNSKAFTIHGICSSYKLFLLNPVFMGCTIVGSVAISVSMAYATTSSFIFQTSFHLSPIDYGWATAIAGAGAIAGKIFAPSYINWKGPYKTLFAGLMMALIPGLLLLALQLLGLINVPLLVTLVFFTLFGQTFITPITLSKALSPFHKSRGAAGALYGGFQYLTSFIASAIIALFSVEGVTVLSIAYILLSVIGLIVFYWLINDKKSK